MLDKTACAQNAQACAHVTTRPGDEQLQRRRRWRQAEDRYLEETYTAGAPIAGIAKALGRTSDAVEARRKALKLQRIVRLNNNRSDKASWTPDQIAILERGYAAGTPVPEIAKRVGRGIKATWNFANKRKLKHLSRSFEISSEMEATIRKGATEGRRAVQVARDLGIDPTRLNTLARRLGIRFQRTLAFTAAQLAQIDACESAGATISACAAELNMSYDALTRRLREIGRKYKMPHRRRADRGCAPATHRPRAAPFVMPPAPVAAEEIHNLHAAPVISLLTNAEHLRPATARAPAMAVQVAPKKRKSRPRRAVKQKPKHDLTALTRQALQDGTAKITKCPPGPHLGWRPEWLQGAGS